MGWGVVVRTGRFPVQTPLDVRPGLGSQPRYKKRCDLRVEYVKTKWLTSDEWGCPLNNNPKLAVGSQIAAKPSPLSCYHFFSFRTFILSEEQIYWDTEFSLLAGSCNSVRLWKLKKLASNQILVSMRLTSNPTHNLESIFFKQYFINTFL